MPRENPAPFRKSDPTSAHRAGAPPLIRVYQMPPPAIAHITHLVEAYDGIGSVRTLDESRGIIECWVMPDAVHAFDRLLNQIGAEYPLQRLGRDFDS